MKRLFVSFFMVVAAGLVVMGCNDDADPLVAPNDQAIAENSTAVTTLAKKPAPVLTFTAYADFLGGSPTWGGTVTLEGVGTYGVSYFNLSGPPRDWSQAKPFEEYWEIYDLGTGVVYLAGTHSGVVSMANSRFLANGKVELATGDFEMWLGRTTHNSGIVYWLPSGFPDHAEGTFRIN